MGRLCYDDLTMSLTRCCRAFRLLFPAPADRRGTTRATKKGEMQGPVACFKSHYGIRQSRNAPIRGHTKKNQSSGINYGRCCCPMSKQKRLRRLASRSLTSVPPGETPIDPPVNNSNRRFQRNHRRPTAPLLFVALWAGQQTKIQYQQVE